MDNTALNIHFAGGPGGGGDADNGDDGIVTSPLSLFLHPPIRLKHPAAGILRPCGTKRRVTPRFGPF